MCNTIFKDFFLFLIVDFHGTCVLGSAGVSPLVLANIGRHWGGELLERRWVFFPLNSHRVLGSGKTVCGLSASEGGSVCFRTWHTWGRIWTPITHSASPLSGLALGSPPEVTLTAEFPWRTSSGKASCDPCPAAPEGERDFFSSQRPFYQDARLFSVTIQKSLGGAPWEHNVSIFIPSLVSQTARCCHAKGWTNKFYKMKRLLRGSHHIWNTPRLRWQDSLCTEYRCPLSRKRWDENHFLRSLWFYNLWVLWLLARGYYHAELTIKHISWLRISLFNGENR